MATGINQFKGNIKLGNVTVPLGKYTSAKPLVFITQVDTYFDGTTIPMGTEIKFFESRNFGFITFHQNGKLRILKE